MNPPTLVLKFSWMLWEGVCVFECVCEKSKKVLSFRPQSTHYRAEAWTLEKLWDGTGHSLNTHTPPTQNTHRFTETLLHRNFAKSQRSLRKKFRLMVPGSQRQEGILLNSRCIAGHRAGLRAFLSCPAFLGWSLAHTSALPTSHYQVLWMSLQKCLLGQLQNLSKHI